jgi:hypothetical protein
MSFSTAGLSQDCSCRHLDLHLTYELAGGRTRQASSVQASRSPRSDIIWRAYLPVPLYALRRVAAWPVTYVVVTDRRMMLIGGLLRRTAAATPWIR